MLNLACTYMYLVYMKLFPIWQALHVYCLIVLMHFFFSSATSQKSIPILDWTGQIFFVQQQAVRSLINCMTTPIITDSYEALETLIIDT